MENARGVQATGVILLISEIARTGKNPHGFIRADGSERDA
jgi:hypothetical protein